MNQIPNIEETNTREVERKTKILESTACCRACYRQRKQLVDEIVEALKQDKDHQLQKAYEQGSLDGYKNGLKTAVDMGQCKFPTNGITDKTELQKAREQAYKDGARDVRDFAQVEIMKRASQLRDDITTFTSETIHSELDQDKK